MRADIVRSPRSSAQRVRVERRRDLAHVRERRVDVVGRQFVVAADETVEHPAVVFRAVVAEILIIVEIRDARFFVLEIEEPRVVVLQQLRIRRAHRLERRVEAAALQQPHPVDDAVRRGEEYELHLRIVPDESAQGVRRFLRFGEVRIRDLKEAMAADGIPTRL